MRDLNRKKTRGVKPRARTARRPLKPSEGRLKFKKIARIVSFIIMAAVIGGGGGFGVRRVYAYLLTSQAFAVKSIEITGSKKLNRKEILELAGIREGQNIFSINADDAVEHIAAHPWIKGVTVRRQFPDRVIIRVVEREAESLVRMKGKNGLSALWLADGSGEIFKPAESGDVVDLPVIVPPPGDESGEGGAPQIKKALELIKMAANSGLLPAEQISEVLISPTGDITLITTGALERVEAGRGDLKAKWAMLETALADVKRSGMEAVSVNLNYRNGAAVRLKRTDVAPLVADVHSSGSLNGPSGGGLR